jgi:tRNA threonylcarbamoyl adenosine modification protein YeaZ
MKILAVEFSSEQRSVAVVLAEKWQERQRRPAAEEDRAQPPGASNVVLLGRAVESGGHRALGLVEEALRQASCEREEIETLAIGLGPGSYTGVRGAIALAQGWQLGRGIQVLGLSSVECLAAGAERERLYGPASIVIDAQRNEFYVARYEIAPGAWRETEALRLAARAEIEARAQRGETLLGPGVAEWFPSARNLHPDAAILGRLASERRDFMPAEKLEPIYLRETAFKKAPPSRAVV